MFFRAIGVISGTSMDGIDVALVRTDGETVAERGPGCIYPYPDWLRESLGKVVSAPARAQADPLTELEAALTHAHGDAIARFLTEFNLHTKGVDLIGLHGQTILHRPDLRLTRQLGNGSVIAKRFGIRCVDGFRLADVAAGGQGAPLAPLYHAALAAPLQKPVAVLNLGGVGNVTFIAGDAVIAFDTGPASALIDDFMVRRCGMPFDENGRLASKGQVDTAVLNAFLALPFFRQPAPKSLDRNAFHNLMPRVEALDDADGVATLAACTVQSIVAARNLLPVPPLRWLVTGGGRRNGHFMVELARVLGVPVVPVETVGWDGDTMEAELFGYLAVRTVKGLALSLPTTTGVPFPMPGGRVHDV